jgi:hypothetical protein
MPSILQTIVPSYAQDVVAVYTQDLTQVFPDARPIKAVIKEESKVMEHPVETGVITTDHRVILPVECELSMVVNSEDYPDVYQLVRGYYLNATLLIVQTKVGIYPNQMIAAMPHEEDPSLYNTVAIALKMKQVLFVTAAYGVVPKNVNNSTVTDTGVQQPAVPSESALSQTATGLKNGMMTVYKGLSG